MSADDAINSAEDSLSQTITYLAQVCVEEVSGTDEYTSERLDELHEAFQLLLKARRLLCGT
jgi:hypothetical protein